nr:MAG TPA: hypothetical protein [Caudoviricetes sp.]
MLKEFVNDVILRNRPEHTIIEEYGAYFDVKGVKNAKRICK